MDLADITATATSTTAVVQSRNPPLTKQATSPIVLCCVQMSFLFFFAYVAYGNQDCLFVCIYTGIDNGACRRRCAINDRIPTACPELYSTLDP